MASTHMTDEIFSAGGSTDGTVPPGETVSVDVHQPMDNGRRGIYDNPRYNQYHPHSAPLPASSARSASATRVTGINLELLTRPPPPLWPSQNPAPVRPTSQPNEAASRGRRFHPYAR